MNYEIKQIAHIENDFQTKFGIPRQAGIADSIQSRIVFEPEYRNPDALRGIESFSHLWLIWQFSENVRENWSPTVRPPRLGGNVRMGVFATRSPFRPNAIGLSCVRLIGKEHTDAFGEVLVVAGADLMNGTPIFDIKPYIPYADCRQEASEGFAPEPVDSLEVQFALGMEELVPAEKLEGLTKILSGDPRPRYQNDRNRVYGMEFAGMEIRFSVEGKILTVREIADK